MASRLTWEWLGMRLNWGQCWVDCIRWQPLKFRALTDWFAFPFQVIIVGGYSDSYLFYNTEVTTREIIGLVLAGDVHSSSVIITGGTTVESLENLHDAIKRLESSDVPKENSFSLMFSCFSRGIMTYGYENAECSAFSDTFPRTPLVGFFGTGAFGCDREKLKTRGLKPGGRDFLHLDATVLCLTSLAP